MYKNIYYKCIYCNYINNKEIVNDRCINQLYLYYSLLYNCYFLSYNYHVMVPHESESYTNLLLCTPLYPNP